MEQIMLGHILELNISERIQLVEDIWDSIDECPDAVPLTDIQKTELDRLLEDYQRNPEQGTPWAVVRERIRGSR